MVSLYDDRRVRKLALIDMDLGFESEGEAPWRCADLRTARRRAERDADSPIRRYAVPNDHHHER